MSSSLKTVESKLCELAGCRIRKISGFPDYYIAENGSVFSTKFGQLKELRPNCKKAVRLLMDGKPKNQRVAHLLASAFLDNPTGSKRIFFKDKNPENIAIDNISWSDISPQYVYKKALQEIVNAMEEIPFRDRTSREQYAFVIAKEGLEK